MLHLAYRKMRGIFFSGAILGRFTCGNVKKTMCYADTYNSVKCNIADCIINYIPSFFVCDTVTQTLCPGLCASDTGHVAILKIDTRHGHPPARAL